MQEKSIKKFKKKLQKLATQEKVDLINKYTEYSKVGEYLNDYLPDRVNFELGAMSAYQLLNSGVQPITDPKDKNYTLYFSVTDAIVKIYSRADVDALFNIMLDKLVAFIDEKKDVDMYRVNQIYKNIDLEDKATQGLNKASNN